MDLRKASRTYRVTEAFIKPIQFSDEPLAMLENSILQENGAERGWLLVRALSDGFVPSFTRRTFFNTKEEAEACMATEGVGATLTGESVMAKFQAALDTEQFREHLNEGSPIFHRGDEDLFLPWAVLREAGLNDGFDLTPEVEAFLGHERFQELKSSHPDNWKCIAELEFCMAHFAESSAAYVAALCRYNYFVREDDFAAGFLLRDLEFIYHGVEELAQRAFEYQQNLPKNAKRGGDANREKAEKRLKAFMTLALETATDWAWMRQSDQVAFLREKMREADEKFGSEIFTHGKDVMSKTWVEDKLSGLRSSGALKERIAGKP